MWWKAILETIVSFLGKPLALLAAYRLGKRAERQELATKQAEQDARDQKEFGRIAGEKRTADGAADKLRDGKF